MPFINFKLIQVEEESLGLNASRNKNILWGNHTGERINNTEEVLKIHKESYKFMF